MLNQVVLVGKVSVTIQEGSLNRSWVVIDVQRATKGVFAEDYPVDSIRVFLREDIVENVSKFAKEGTTVAFKATLEVENNDILVIADRVSILKFEEEAN